MIHITYFSKSHQLGSGFSWKSISFSRESERENETPPINCDIFLHAKQNSSGSAAKRKPKVVVGSVFNTDNVKE